MITASIIQNLISTLMPQASVSIDEAFVQEVDNAEMALLVCDANHDCIITVDSDGCFRMMGVHDDKSDREFTLKNQSLEVQIEQIKLAMMSIINPVAA